MHNGSTFTRMRLTISVFVIATLLWTKSSAQEITLNLNQGIGFSLMDFVPSRRPGTTYNYASERAMPGMHTHVRASYIMHRDSSISYIFGLGIRKDHMPYYHALLSEGSRDHLESIRFHNSFNASMVYVGIRYALKEYLTFGITYGAGFNIPQNKDFKTSSENQTYRSFITYDYTLEKIAYPGNAHSVELNTSLTLKEGIDLIGLVYLYAPDNVSRYSIVTDQTIRSTNQDTGFVTTQSYTYDSGFKSIEHKKYLVFAIGISKRIWHK